jgi:hypothetical protein
MLLATGTRLTPDVGILIALCLGGSAYTLASKNANVKRVVFPLVLAASNVLLFVVLRRSGVLPQVPDIVLIALLTANALYTMRIVRFCETCGRTVGVPLLSTEPPRCTTCRTVSAP